jgi:hypothetical protein
MSLEAAILRLLDAQQGAEKGQLLRKSRESHPSVAKATLIMLTLCGG